MSTDRHLQNSPREIAFSRASLKISLRAKNAEQSVLNAFIIALSKPDEQIAGDSAKIQIIMLELRRKSQKCLFPL
jgi:hypothetical protein